jgi:hypothetical protein
LLQLLIAALSIELVVMYAVIHTNSVIGWTGSGTDGAEEIKRHTFFSTIDWNVSGASPLALIAHS